MTMTLASLFFNHRTGRVRWGWRLSAFGILFYTLLVVFGGLFSLAFGSGADAARETYAYQVARRFGNQGLSIATCLLASVTCMRLFDRGGLHTIGYRFQRGWWRDYLGGWLISFSMLVTVALVGLLSGLLSIEPGTGQTKSVTGSVVLAVIFFNAAAINEELIFRGYPLRTLLLDLPPAFAVAVQGFLFGLVHLPNPGSTGLSTVNTILAGFWLGAACYRTRNLWLCTGLHAAWNIGLGPVLGLSVSGLDPMIQQTLFRSHVQGPAWLLGGAYGPEGGIVVTGVLLVTLFMLARGKSNSADLQLPEYADGSTGRSSTRTS
ncbi:MAG: CPBP family intramembrane metalloprotease [Acidobacteria bacterium]|nr:CPBP family intramembrane metalloprotease [Acidobacteriota bacterium]